MPKKNFTALLTQNTYLLSFKHKEGLKTASIVTLASRFCFWQIANLTFLCDIPFLPKRNAITFVAIYCLIVCLHDWLLHTRSRPTQPIFHLVTQNAFFVAMYHSKRAIVSTKINQNWKAISLKSQNIFFKDCQAQLQPDIS